MPTSLWAATSVRLAELNTMVPNRKLNGTLAVTVMAKQAVEAAT